MVRHIVMWNYGDGFSDDENRQNAQEVKSQLENLKACIGGIIELRVRIDALPTGNRDIVLNSLFADEAALAAYQVDPEHRRVSKFVGSVMKNRTCIDFFEFRHEKG